MLDGDIDGFIESYLRMKLAKGTRRPGESLTRPRRNPAIHNPISRGAEEVAEKRLIDSTFSAAPRETLQSEPAAHGGEILRRR